MRKFFITVFVLAVLLALLPGRTAKQDFPAIKESGSALRLVCIYSGSSTYYKYALKKGLDKAAEETNAWVMFKSFETVETEKHIEAFDMAIAAKVDGIITNVPDNKKIYDLINTASTKNIPVVTVETDLPKSKRIAYVGTNSYEYGCTAAKLMAKATGSKASAAIFENYSSNRKSLKNQGFQNTARKYPAFTTEVYSCKGPSIMEYTNIAHTIFLSKPQIKSFFCGDPESTLGVSRAILEFNKTDSTVIGSGDSEEILKYVKYGRIYASLVEDPFTAGYRSLKSLVDYKKGETVSEVVNPDIMVVTRDNVDALLTKKDR